MVKWVLMIAGGVEIKVIVKRSVFLIKSSNEMKSLPLPEIMKIKKKRYREK